MIFFFFAGHCYGQMNLWVEFISHMQCLHWGPEFKRATLWLNPAKNTNAMIFKNTEQACLFLQMRMFPD